MSGPFDELGQRRMHFLCIASILRKRVLVADGFRLFVKVKVSGVQSLSLAVERFPPLAKQLVQSSSPKRGQLSYFQRIDAAGCAQRKSIWAGQRNTLHLPIPRRLILEPDHALTDGIACNRRNVGIECAPFCTRNIRSACGYGSDRSMT